MFRTKDRMLKECRTEKKKNTNKEDRAVRKVNEKDEYRFEVKGIQQELIRRGIKVHKNELREMCMGYYYVMTEEEKEKTVGNTTKGVLHEVLREYGYGEFKTGNNRVIAKTHDMTKWQDKKKQSLDKKRRRDYKAKMQESVE